MSKIIMSLAARRAQTTARTTWGLHWAAIAARLDQNRQGLPVTRTLRVRAADVTVVAQHRRPAATKPRPVLVEHVTSVRPDGAGTYVAVCACGGWSSRPLTERGAKGQATRHVKSVVVPVAVAA